MYLAKPERQTTRGDHRTLAKVTHVITEEEVPEDPYIYMEARIQKVPHYMNCGKLREE